MDTKGKVVATAMLAGLAALGTMPAASASEASTQYASTAVFANLDGDSHRDTVIISTATATSVQVKFKLDDGRVAVRDVATNRGFLKPQVRDIYKDGKNEIGVYVGSGASEQPYLFFRYDPSYGVRAVRGDDGGPFQVDIGGAGAYRLTYGCIRNSSGTTLQKINGEIESDGEHWDITRDYYTVSQNAILHKSTRKYIHVSSTHPLLSVDPNTCN